MKSGWDIFAGNEWSIGRCRAGDNARAGGPDGAAPSAGLPPLATGRPPLSKTQIMETHLLAKRYVTSIVLQHEQHLAL